MQKLLRLCVVGVLFPLSCLGQAVTSLRGRVTDPSKAAVSGARVSLTLTTTGAMRNDVTDDSGNYQFLQLAPGSYTLRVESSGFATGVREGLVLQVATPATLDVTMSVAANQENIQVVGSAAPMLNTTDATIGNAFNSQQIATLPIEGRNVVELLSLQPGVTFLGKSSFQNDDDSRAGAVNGSRSDQANVTLDGVDVNDQNKGYAFDSVLRMTQDSVAEFRVTTTNPTADAGRGGGAQVALLTKGGTNLLHGSLYEYNRNVAFAANNFFNKQTQLASGEPNQPGKLIRNVFGGSVGGPLRKEKLFYFLNYEGERRNESQVVERTVPTDSLRSGTMQYMTEDQSVYALTPAKIQAMDPLKIGVNPAILNVLAGYPHANDSTAGDGLNTAGYRFLQAIKSSFNTYVARMDWNAATRHTLFWRGNLLNDDEPGVSQFPGQPAASRSLSNNKGMAVGYTYVITPQLVNNFRWGLTRQGGSTSGISTDPSVSLDGIDEPVSFSRGSSFHIPVNNFVDDLAWTKGQHSLSFGINLRVIDDARSSTENSFPDANINIGWMQPSAIASNSNAPLNPELSGYPAVSSDFYQSYDYAMMNMIGLVSEVNAVYNYDKSGSALALGAPIGRDYRWNEYDFYGQDTWKASPDMTFTYGLHYSLLQPPTESHGVQVGPCVISNGGCTPYALSDYVKESAIQGATGGSASAVPDLSFALNGRSNGRPDFWNMDKKNLAPRLAFAWEPNLGGAGKTSVRGGYSLVFDHFGAAVINSFDTTGSFGLTSKVSNPPGVQTPSTAPRFSGISAIPSGLLPPAPVGGFPATPDAGGLIISWGLDSKIKTPYEHLLDFSIQRVLSKSSTIEVAYVGRLAHRLLEQEDVAMPLNLRAAGVDYFNAAVQMSKMAYANTPVGNVQSAAYWESLFGGLAGMQLCQGDDAPINPTATQNIYCLFQQNLGNETNVLYTLDTPGNGTGAGSLYPANRFYHGQYSALYAWRSMGRSSYHAAQVIFRQRFSGGLQADVNYTYSRSIDWTSQAERLGASGGNNGAQIINTWQPDQLRGVSDFDMTHQLNANWIWDLPVGRGRHWLSDSSRLTDSFVGGWQLTGILRLTSGLPYQVDNGSRWPTNWDIEGFATLAQAIPGAAKKHGHLQQMFKDPDAVYASFRPALPGESGTRNPLRGDGYYSLDAGLNKSFPIHDRIVFRLRWDTFNVTNSSRFDSHSVRAQLDEANSFGNATGLLTQPRVMQVAGRIDF